MNYPYVSTLYFIFFINIIESIYKKLEFNYIFIYTLCIEYN